MENCFEQEMTVEKMIRMKVETRNQKVELKEQRTFETCFRGNSNNLMNAQPLNRLYHQKKS